MTWKSSFNINDATTPANTAKVDASGNLYTAPYLPTNTGSITALSQHVDLNITNSPASGWCVTFSGIWSGTISFQYSFDNSTWSTANLFSPIFGLTTQSSSSGTNLSYYGQTFGATYVRCLASAWTSGTANLVITSYEDVQIPITTVAIDASNSHNVVAINNGSTLPLYTAAVGDLGFATSLNSGTSTWTSSQELNFGGLIFCLEGTWSANFVLEGKMNSTWYLIPMWVCTNTATGNFVPATSISVNCQVKANMAGYQNVRLRATSFSSGTTTLEGVFSKYFPAPGVDVGFDTSNPNFTSLSGGLGSSVGDPIYTNETSNTFPIVSTAISAAAVPVYSPNLDGNCNSWSILVTGTWTGTLIFQASVDGGNWYTVYGQVLGSSPGSFVSSYSDTGSGTAVTITGAGVQGAKSFRTYLSAYSSGTATIVGMVSTAALPQTTQMGDINTVNSSIYLARSTLDQLKAKSTKATFDTGFVSITPTAGWIWKAIQEWVLPANGFLFVPCTFGFTASAAGYLGRLVEKTRMASYNKGTATFTAGTSTASDLDYWTDIEGVVTTAVGTGATTITVTYTDQGGTTGNSGTISLASASAVGTKAKMTFAGGDIGAISITAVSWAGSTSGAIDIIGCKQIAEYGNSGAGVATSVALSESLSFLPGSTLSTEVAFSAATAATMRASCSGYYVSIV